MFGLPDPDTGYRPCLTCRDDSGYMDDDEMVPCADCNREEAEEYDRRMDIEERRFYDRGTGDAEPFASRLDYDKRVR